MEDVLQGVIKDGIGRGLLPPRPLLAQAPSQLRVLLRMAKPEAWTSPCATPKASPRSGAAAA